MSENSFSFVVVGFEKVDVVIRKFPVRQNRPDPIMDTEGNAAKKSKAAEIGILLGTRKGFLEPS